MKLDKETVVKHQFWFMLGGFALLWLIAITSLKILASGPIEAKKKAYETSAANLKAAQAKKPKNPATFLPPWKDNADLFRSKRDEVWSVAFGLQKDGEGGPFETWPEVGRMRTLKYPEDTDRNGQPIPSAEDRQEYMTRGYLEQFKDIDKIAAPVELLGQWEAIMAPQTWTKIPSREECWLAQEDLWVKRELLRVVKAANDLVARFRLIDDQQLQKELKEEAARNQGKPVEPPPAGTQKHLRYRNHSWQMDLYVGKDGLLPGSTLKNVHPASRTLALAAKNDKGNLVPLDFRLRQGTAEFTLRASGESVFPGASVRIIKDKPVSPSAFQLSEPFDVEEVFVWETAPVKRIDAIRAPYQSNRTYTMTLKAMRR